MIQSWPEWARRLPDALRIAFLGVATWQLIGIVLLVLLTMAACFVGRGLAIWALGLRERFVKQELTPETRQALRRTVGLLTGVIVGYPIIRELALPVGMDTAIRTIYEGVAILAAVLLLLALWDSTVDRLHARAAGVERAERLLLPIARKFVRAVIMVTAILIALATLFHVNVSAVLASLGIGGLVVALAAKDSVENVFGSLTILFDMPFAIGDWVKIDKAEGIVEEINLRSTRIRTFEDTVITLPNANLIRASVENFSARRARRQQINVRVSYDTNPEALDAFRRDLVLWLDEQPLVVREKTIVDLSEMNEPSLSLLVQCHFEVTTQAEELNLRHLVVMEILRLRDRHGVLFAAHPRPLPPAA